MIHKDKLNSITKKKIEEAVALTIKHYGKVLLKLGSNDPDSISLDEGE